MPNAFGQDCKSVPPCKILQFKYWVSLNHKSHEMTSSKFFQTRSFCGTKISLDGRSEIVACWHVTRILQRFVYQDEFAKMNNHPLQDLFYRFLLCHENNQLLEYVYNRGPRPPQFKINILFNQHFP